MAVDLEEQDYTNRLIEIIKEAVPRIAGEHTEVLSNPALNEEIDRTFTAIEMVLDEVDSDLDYSINGGVLTVDFENGSTMVFSRQPPTCQLWLASRSGGYHFAWDEAQGDWRNTRDGSLFRPFVVEQMSSQAGVEFSWE